MPKPSRRAFLTATTGAVTLAAADRDDLQKSKTARGPNIVFIMTDTQGAFMVGAYGDPKMDTPNLDKLAASGVRFDRAYTTCPVCTPARAGIFTGQYPQLTGAWCNNTAPARNVPLMGEIFRAHGYRAAYTGKWHLEGGGYFGDGVPRGGFEGDWWYDGFRYAQDIGPEMFKAYQKSWKAQQLREAGFTVNNIWGHRVADRAIDFLEKTHDEPFVLAVSFDEPHGPCVAPPEYWENFPADSVPKRPNYNAPVDNKPLLQQVQHAENGDVSWEVWSQHQQRMFACNSYIDREIGRVVDAIDALCPDNTIIIYTSDHGTHCRAHGLISKGPTMYEETTNIPFIVRVPGGPSGAINSSPVSHVDILPTMMDYCGIPPHRGMTGKSLRPVLEETSNAVNEYVFLSWERFARNHSQNGELYPIRAITDGRYKLCVNLMDTDELYDLKSDPYEMDNRINDEVLATKRDEMHDRLMLEMYRTLDPFRGIYWRNRPWRNTQEPMFYSASKRNKKKEDS